MEQRKSQRFRIELPVEITQLSGRRVNRAVKVLDISSSGISFLSSREWEVGGKIEYVVTLSAETKIRIRCLGKIVRVENTPNAAEASYKVAATMERYEFLRAN
ncbi:MAG: PilZ domain-containing protein [Acidobacteriota bacterium]|nr:PilZ domain-containing protein [Acidobacteriota bacterium]